MKSAIMIMNFFIFQQLFAGLALPEDEGIDLSFDEYYVPPLVAAIAHNDIDQMRNIIARDRNEVNASVDEWDQTPLFYAVADNNHNTTNVLLQSGAHVNHQEHFGSTPLAVAAFYGYVAMAQLLLSHGAYVDLENDEGKNALEVARLQGKNEMVQLLENALVQQRRNRFLRIQSKKKKSSEVKYFASSIKVALWAIVTWMFLH